MTIPVLVRSVGPEPSAGYYTQWTTFVPGYPKFKNQDTGVTSALYNGAAIEANLLSYRAHHLYFTGTPGEIVDRLVDIPLPLPDAGEYYDIPVTGYQTGGTGLNPNPGSSSGTSQPSGPARLDITVSESFTLRSGDAKTTPWMPPHVVRQLASGVNSWINLDGAKARDDGVRASKIAEVTTGYKLVGQDFRFQIPNGTAITGVEVDITRSGEGVASELVELTSAGKSLSTGDPWNISAAEYNGNYLDYSAQSTDSSSLAFDGGGTLYVLHNSFPGEKISRYFLSNDWDLSTASFDQTYSSISGGEDIFAGGGYIYTLSTGTVFQYDATTMALVNSISVSAQDTSMIGICFSPGGGNMYTVGVANDRVYRYTLGAAWDITSATYSGQFMSVGSQDGLMRGVHIRSDGLRLYVQGQTNDRVFQYDLPTAFSLVGASYSGVSATLNENGTSGLDFSSDGTAFFVVDSNSDTVYRYDMATLAQTRVDGQLYDEGYLFVDGGVYGTTFTELFSGAGTPQADITVRSFFSGGVDDTAGLSLAAQDVNSIGFGVSFTTTGGGLVAVDSMSMRVHYRGTLGADTLPAKRSAGLAGVAESPSGVKVAVGVDGKILRKPANNPTWSVVTSGTTVSLNAVEWVGDRFIAVGMFGMALDGGADGSTWTRIDTGAVSSLWAIKRVPNSLRAVAVGNDDYSFERGRNGGWST